MKNIIIGTAGHVDHGKTALIKALTGIETDRIKEEKKRGITIELGFAYLDLPDGEKAGIIDVPGHEKFVKNMLAGAGGIDLALLVVAADQRGRSGGGAGTARRGAKKTDPVSGRRQQVRSAGERG